MLRFKGELEPYEEAVGVKALDRRTLQVELVQPTPHFLISQLLTYLPAPRHLVERYGEDFHRPIKLRQRSIQDGVLGARCKDCPGQE